MLRLTIEPWAQVRIGKDIVIHNPTDRRIPLGITAPKDVPVKREPSELDEQSKGKSK